MPKGLDYIINIKDGDLGGVSHAREEVETLDGAIERSHEGFLGLGGAAVAVGNLVANAATMAVEKIIDFGKESYEVFKTTNLATSQLAQGLKSTGDISGKSLDELTEKAEQLEKTTLFSQAQTEQAQAIQLTFTNIRGAIYDEAIPAIQDMATRMAGGGPADLAGATVLVDKALQDPIKGIAALHRVGVDFSAAQEKMIATDIKHGQAQKAEGIILKELQTEFGGSAAAARKAMGPMGDLTQQIEELKKGTGKLIDDGLRVVVPLLLDFENGAKGVYHALQAGYHWVKDNADIFKALGIAVATAGVGFLIANPAVVAWGVDAGIAAITTGGLAVAEGLLTVAQWGLNAAMDANPIGAVVTVIGLLVGGIYLAYQRSETFRAILAGIGGVAEELTPIFKGLGEIILGAFTLDSDEISKGFSDAANAAQKVLKDGGISGIFRRDYDASIAESHRQAAAAGQGGPPQPPKPPAPTPSAQVPGQPPPYSVGGSGRGGHGHGGSDSTTLSGGRSVRNVHVTIGKLVEKIELHTMNIQGMGAQDLKRRLTEILTEAVHDSELALGSQ